MSKLSVFIDTSFFKAILDEKDEFYGKAVKIWEELKEEDAELTTSNFVLDEVFTLIRKRRGIKKLAEIRQFLIDNAMGIKIFRVTTADEAEAWNWLLKDWADLSFTDCVSFAVMKRMEIERAATFDTHFERAGFEIA